MLDTEGVKAILPHREPFLLVDVIDELEPGVRAVGRRVLREEDFWFRGHFPGHPVMPGVLMVEAMAQVGAVALLALPENRGKIAFFAGIDKVRFKRQVVPGDELRMELAVTKTRGAFGWGEGTAYVGEELACSGELMFAIQ